MTVEQSPALSSFCEVTVALIGPHHWQQHQWLSAGQGVLNFLSLGHSSKLLTSILNILKLVLYFTEKSMKCVLDNNQDLWCFLEWSLGFFLSCFFDWVLKGHQLCDKITACAGSDTCLDCCLSTHDPQTPLIPPSPLVWNMENGIFQKEWRSVL